MYVLCTTFVVNKRIQ